MNPKIYLCGDLTLCISLRYVYILLQKNCISKNIIILTKNQELAHLWATSIFFFSPRTGLLYCACQSRGAVEQVSRHGRSSPTKGAGLGLRSARAATWEPASTLFSQSWDLHGSSVDVCMCEGGRLLPCPLLAQPASFFMGRLDPLPIPFIMKTGQSFCATDPCPITQGLSLEECQSLSRLLKDGAPTDDAPGKAPPLRGM